MRGSLVRTGRTCVLFVIVLLGGWLLHEPPLEAGAVESLYVNGGFATGTVSESGASAPAGTQWSEAPNPFGNTQQANTSAGVSCSVTTTTTFRCADDFNVRVGQSWTLTQVVVNVYQTGFAGVTSPVIAATLRIWSGRPDDAGSVVVYGDTTTNRLGSSVDSGIWRLFNSVVGSGANPPTAPATNRKVWRTAINVSPALVLGPGNYWIDWNTEVSASAAHFAPPVTYRGTRDNPGLNARQFSSTTGTWSDIVDPGQFPTGAPTPTPVFQDFPFELIGAATPQFMSRARTLDFDGDNKTDWGIARAASVGAQTTFWVNRSTLGVMAAPWGIGVGFAGGDIATPADYDGDGKTDIAVWRPGNATFYVAQSSNGAVKIQQFGLAGDDPTVVGDYDGDNKADFAVYRPGASPGQQSVWYVLRSSDSTTAITAWGLNGDRAYPADFDGDRKLDVSVIRNSGGQAVVYQFRSGGAVQVIPFGLFTDKFVVGDFDQDGRHDLAAVRNIGGAYQWFVTKSGTGQLISYTYGVSSIDFLTPGDYDGDNRTDSGVWRSGGGGAAFFEYRSGSSPSYFPWGLSAGVLTAPDVPLGVINVR